MPDLIALADLRTITGLNSSVEERKVVDGIADAHLELEKVLGRTGYAIVYAAAPDFTSLAPNAAAYVTLLGYIKAFMAWRAKQRAYPEMYAEAERGGVFTKSGNDYSTVGGRDLSLLISAAKDRADERLQRLIDHLYNNTTVFTWYTTNVNGEPRINDSRTGGGFSFRRSVRQDDYRG